MMTFYDDYAEGYEAGAKAERERLSELLREIVNAVPQFDHPAIDYVTIQVDRRWLAEAKEAIDD